MKKNWEGLWKLRGSWLAGREPGRAGTDLLLLGLVICMVEGSLLTGVQVLIFINVDNAPMLFCFYFESVNIHKESEHIKLYLLYNHLIKTS